jgi:hypothetical protein
MFGGFICCLKVISYTLRDIKDEESYMESMGQARTSEVLRDARIGNNQISANKIYEKPGRNQWVHHAFNIFNFPKRIDIGLFVEDYFAPIDISKSKLIV